MLLVALGLRAVMLLLQLVAYATFAYDGDEHSAEYVGVETAAQLVELAYEVTYITLLVCLVR